MLATTTLSPFFGQTCGTPFSILSKMGKGWSSFLLPIAAVRQACVQRQAACIGLVARGSFVLQPALTRPKWKSLYIWTQLGQTDIPQCFVVFQQLLLVMIHLYCSDFHPSLTKCLQTAELTRLVTCCKVLASLSLCNCHLAMMLTCFLLTVLSQIWPT